jgi:AraC-like DNA-binding protein
MTKAPALMTVAPSMALPVPGPAGTDLLSDALGQLRLSGATLLRGEFTAPWAWAAPHSTKIAAVLKVDHRRLMLFHIVSKGRCWLELDGLSRMELEEGELVALPHGDPHVMGSGDAAPIPVASLFPPTPWRDLPVLRHGGSGPSTGIVCTYLSFDRPLFSPLLECLPRLLIIRREDRAAREWIQASVSYLVDGATRGGSGSSFLAMRITELLFLELLRLHVVRLPAEQSGWLAALRDRHVSLALHLMHNRPADQWTMDSLARRAGLSRSPLEARFNRLLGQPAMRYLTRWRLQLAAGLLAGGTKPVVTIAREVGYSSEEAFSRAFKRETGSSPSEWRRRAQPG